MISRYSTDLQVVVIRQDTEAMNQRRKGSEEENGLLVNNQAKTKIGFASVFWENKCIELVC